MGESGGAADLVREGLDLVQHSPDVWHNVAPVRLDDLRAGRPVSMVSNCLQSGPGYFKLFQPCSHPEPEVSELLADAALASGVEESDVLYKQDSKDLTAVSPSSYVTHHTCALSMQAQATHHISTSAALKIITVACISCSLKALHALSDCCSSVETLRETYRFMLLEL